MSTIITGLGSGLDISGLVSQLVAAKETTLVTPLENKLSTLEKKSSALTTLKSKFSSLQTALQAFTKAMYNSSSDMWTNTTITSSNDSYATATSSGSVSAAQIELMVEQIATATTAKSVNSLGATSKEALENTKFVNLANGQAKEGTFSMFLDGKEYSIEIDKEDTLKDVMNKISDVSEGKITASLDDSGNFSISSAENTNLILGSTGDTSNLASAFKLLEKQGTNSYSSSYPLSNVNTSAKMNTSESGLLGLKFYNEDGSEATSGKIIINGEEIEVNGDMSINDLVSKINGNSDTKVKASYDSLTNKISLTSTQTGESNISLSSEGTNLLNILGLTQGEGEDEVLMAGSQELGQNAIVYINGNRVVSNSNTITGESSGIANLSLTVKKQTSDYSGNNDDLKSVTLDIEPDHTKIKESLEAFVKAYNDVVSNIKTMTDSEGAIGRDSSLNSILSQLRSITSTVSDNDGVYSMLAQIGITSNSDDVSQLEIDYDKLDEALSKNLESVKLLLSDGYTSKDDNGIFDGLVNKINNILDTEKGYFTTQSESVQSLISSMNTRIERANERLLNYETRITNQFNKMDSTIATLNSQLSTFMSYIG